MGDAVAYRDGRTSGMDVISEKCVPFEELYERTGIQKQVFNTLYQLTALQKEQPDLLERAHRLLMVPDYLHYCLTGKKENEYTEATTSALVNAKEKTWDWELIDRFGLDVYKRQAQDDHIIFVIPILFIELLNFRHFCPAGRAPSGPKIEEYSFSFVIRKGMGFTELVCQGEIRRRCRLFCRSFRSRLLRNAGRTL